ncbi:hypothetical protein Rmf_14830 [Roseomonas fluvialis]|uniref:Uncharacterized protein n=2 Tax=Roseomonas fluvialis TaxID=1750527 RepID=A0ABN6P1R2_9PROT|nr:hypothetical protein Rmf_14830 [Roseomonas fluvialis]
MTASSSAPFAAHHSVPLGVRVARPDLATLMDAQPVILVDARLPDAVALHGAGARLCRAVVSPAGVTLRLSHAAVPDQETVTLDHAPSGVLALVAQTPRSLAPLQAWWAAQGVPVPPLIVAESGLAALPALLGLSLAQATEALLQVAALEAQLVALRSEGEELRGAVAALLTTLGGHPPPTLEMRLQTAPDPAAPALLLQPGDPPIVVEPGLPTSGASQLSLHLQRPATAGLAAQLVAAETGRVLAAWRVPAAALPGGWIHLETPEPLAGRAQTLLVLVAAEGAEGSVALSRAADAAADPALAVAVLPPGARLVQPLHFDWESWHGDAPPGIPRLAPAAALAGARLEGPGTLVATSARASLAELPEGWDQARIVLGPLPEGIAALRWDLELEAGLLEARLAVEPAGPMTEWRLLAPGEARPFALPIGPDGSAVLELRGADPASLVLRQPVVFPARMDRAEAGIVPVRLDLADAPLRAPPLRAIEGTYPREAAVPAEPRAPALQTGAEATGTDDDAERVAGYTEVVLDARQRGTDWELLDLRVRDLAWRGERWRELKFKFGIAGSNAVLEFRRAPSWPRAFETWPGTESDAYGDKFVLVVEPERVVGLDRIALGRDTTLVAAIAVAMPRIVAEVLIEEEEAPACAAAATEIAARLAGLADAEAA